mmetsp:Transcript_23732/g.32674  ORF Transcript_23732/g.32674 Transcript_23732/m.32674 type:complete len:508 (-) Transcript_23732:78-1601(-)|eukprot:CAMPEP_0196570452 /NCGR_PEP_ID=MMETSP1081-20130531/533_1 /TAXON_ID=36882 /ORGANISM="Pyramimonas amylifera, Strain CCMP720" /LENGTH=507 /DNA_ID=CAMNT_0041886899 /DNA_START=108 /DNA_END=1634 /DNA_ORIENTATION=+
MAAPSTNPQLSSTPLTNDSSTITQPFLPTSQLVLKDIPDSFLTEAWDLLGLSVPIFISMSSWVTMKTTDTALLGHVGTHFLSASAISDLWTQSTGVLIQGRVLGMFCGQAFGAGNKHLAGIWLQVSYVVLGCISLLVLAAWAVTEPVLLLLGVEEALAKDAAYYAWVLALCIPARIAYSQLSQFFSAQRIMHPSVVTSCMAMLINLAAGLVFVLGIPFPGWSGFGFVACPAVTTGAEYIQILVLWLVFCQIYRLHEDCWPGWSSSHITWGRVCEYAAMYVPSALAIASDFWRMAAIGAVATSLGETEVGVFNASYRVLWMCLTFIGSLSGAVGIKLGIAFGSGRVASAKHTALVGTSLAAVILIGLAVVVYLFPRQLASIFSSDEVVVNMFEEIRLPLAWMMVVMNFSVNLERIPLAMGRSRAVMFLGFVGSWVGQVPAVVLLTQYWRNDLVGLYTGCAIGYTLLVVLYSWLVLTSDWQKYADEARVRSGMNLLADGETEESSDTRA